MKVAVMGYGIVGSGVVEVLKKNREHIAKKSRYGAIDVKYILDIKDITDENACLLTKDFNDILNDEEVITVVETMGGLHPAYEFVSACLKAGKSVVTSNKELVAEKGVELLNLAAENNASFAFEASVAGGIPVIRPLAGSLSANVITEIAGIINGTTNFILTKMINENMHYGEALALAQKNGYAEKDPTADVEGLDACRKICILSMLAYGKHIYPSAVHTEGISALELNDARYASELGYAIKLLGRSKLENGRILIMVSPALVKKSSQIAGVDGVNNAVLIMANAVGEVMMYGPGAGKLPTASAVVSDVIDCCNHYKCPKYFNKYDECDADGIMDYLEAETRLFVRAGSVSHEKITAVFGEVQFVGQDETVFITPRGKERELREKISSLGGEIKSVIRVMDY